MPHGYAPRISHTGTLYGIGAGRASVIVAASAAYKHGLPPAGTPTPLS